ncbi:MAG: tetratricopeptide repeat protein [Planctomycetota bacterium]
MRLAAILCLVGLSGCSVFNHQPIPELGDPDARLDALLVELRDARAIERGEYGPEDPKPKVRTRNELLRELETLAFDFPNNGRVQYACGSAAYSLGRPETATAYLDAAINADPRLTEATALRARMAIEAGNYPRAERLVDDGLLLAPDSGELHLLAAQLLDLDGDAAGALRALDLAAKLGVETWRVEYNRAIVYENQGKVADAERALRRCLDENPDCEEAARRLRRIEAR